MRSPRRWACNSMGWPAGLKRWALRSRLSTARSIMVGQPLRCRSASVVRRTTWSGALSWASFCKVLSNVLRSTSSALALSASTRANTRISLISASRRSHSRVRRGQSRSRSSGLARSARARAIRRRARGERSSWDTSRNNWRWLPIRLCRRAPMRLKSVANTPNSSRRLARRARLFCW